MRAKQASTPAVDTRPIARTVRSMRLEAFTLSVLALCVVVGAVAAAVWFALPALLLLGLVALWPALSARYLNDLALRTAEQLPPRPPRTHPHWLRRLWWWFARRQMQRAARPRPWRGIKVDGVEDAVKAPLAPGEAVGVNEPAVVHGYTASDVYFVVCRAYTYGLGERAVDKYGAKIWTWDEGRKIGLPSGQHLSRTGFRAIQDWLVKRGYASNTPYEFMAGFTPEAVLNALK